MMRLRLLCVVLFLNLYHYVRAVCPHEDDNLENWSSQWSPVATNANITINNPTLLDVVENIEVFGLSINNKFVLKPGMDHVIKAHYIEINDGGELHIGSEDCKFDGNAEIVLLGDENPGYSITSFEDKFLGVRAGGTLEFHGEKILTWTKLINTAPQFDPDLGIIDIKEYDATSASKGAISCHLKQNGDIVDCKEVKLGTMNQKNENNSMDEIINFMKGIDDEDVLTFATHKDIIGTGNLIKLQDYIKTLIPDSAFDDIAVNDAYALLGIVGDQESFKEKLTNVTSIDENGHFYRKALVTKWYEDTEVEIFVDSQNYDKCGKCTVDIGAFNTIYTKPTITVYDDVSSWEVGADILITSTDYDWEQAEVFQRIKSKDTTQKNKIRLNRPLDYEHFGQIYKKVDMRAEVAVLTHNILVRSEVAENSFHGGHVKFLEDFKSVRIEGVEFTQLGNPPILGRYPTHYHMCFDVSDITKYPIETYIRWNSYHDNIFRCMTIHGTSGATIQGNVCYRSFGHGLFLEDGSERETSVLGNLILGQMKWEGDITLGTTGAIPTDQSPVSYWYTNPLTDSRCNVAAGGDGTGYWFVYPNIPTGPSRNYDMMEEKEAMHTKIKNFRDNSGHSYATILMVDNIEKDDLTISGYNLYNPKEDPLNYENSPSIYAEFYRFTGYKAVKQLVWIRGAHINMTLFSLSDSLVGSTIISEDNLQQFFQKGVIIGDSINLGVPAEIEYPNGTKRTLDRSLPMESQYSRPRFAYRFNRGPTSLRDITFYGAENKDLYNWSAIGFHPCLMAFFHPNSDARNLQFGFDDPEEGNRVYDGEDGEHFCSEDGDIIHSFLDEGGSVSGETCRILRNIPFHVTSNCLFRPNWNMVCCESTYAMLEFKSIAHQEVVTVMRTDTPYGESVADGESSTHFYTIVGEGIEYLAYMNMPLPGDVKIIAYGVSSSKTVTLSFCVPRGEDTAIDNLYKIGNRKVTLEKAATYTDFKNSATGRLYYHDTTVGVVMYKLVHDEEFDSDDTVCPDDECVNLKINVNSLDEGDFDCSTRFKDTPAYVRPNKGVPDEYTVQLDADAGDEPVYGVGSTYPCTP